MADRFYSPTPLTLGEVVLTGPEAHHLATVRRFAAGERVILFTGDGNDYPAEVLTVGKRQATLNVVAVEPVNRELGFRLEIAAALPKGDRGDFLIEKLTELGVTRFVPLETARVVVRPKESRIDGLRRAVIEASKQCGRNVLMRVEMPIAWEDFLRETNLPATRIVLHPGTDSLRAVRSGAAGFPSFRGDVIFAIGPEGGFTDGEIAAACVAGWHRSDLGPRTLRVETAAIAAAVLAVSSPSSSAPGAPP
jgi:16S rRNA (uracil1498-N3)-methyltransferase